MSHKKLALTVNPNNKRTGNGIHEVIHSGSRRKILYLEFMMPEKSDTRKHAPRTIARAVILCMRLIKVFCR